MTSKPARTNSMTSGRPTYPRPTTPTTAERRSIFASSASCMDGRSAAIEPAHPGDHLVQLRPGELGEHRQRQHFGGRTLRFRTLPLLVAQVREARLEMEGQRIVDRRADALLLQVRLEGIPTLRAQRVLIVDRLVRRIDVRCL